MSVNQNTSCTGGTSTSNKVKRSSMNRPQSGGLLDDVYIGFRSDIENDSITTNTITAATSTPPPPSYKARLFNLFRQIEKEFDLLYQENQNCSCGLIIYYFIELFIISCVLVQDKVDLLLSEKVERDTLLFDNNKPLSTADCVDLENNFPKVLSKKCKFCLVFLVVSS